MLDVSVIKRLIVAIYRECKSLIALARPLEMGVWHLVTVGVAGARGRGRGSRVVPVKLLHVLESLCHSAHGCAGTEPDTRQHRAQDSTGSQVWAARDGRGGASTGHAAYTES